MAIKRKHERSDRSNFLNIIEIESDFEGNVSLNGALHENAIFMKKFYIISLFRKVNHMLEHFGMKIGDSSIGYKLTRDNYVRISRKSTFIIGEVYDDEYCRDHAINCLINFDYNIDYFKSLDSKEFNSEIDKFLEINPQFKSVIDLNDYRKKPGFYLMILDEYCQAYIGGSSDIYNRIHDHWVDQKPFDRLIFGYVDSSILSIDSFRPLDTTRLFVHTIDDTYTAEDRYINTISPTFMCNRTIGGRLEGGLPEAIANRKERKFDGADFESEVIIEYAETLDPTPVQLHEIYFLINGQRSKIRTILDSKTNHNVEIEYSGTYGKYTFVRNFDKEIVTVTGIS